MTAPDQPGESDEVRRIRAVYADRERRSADRANTGTASLGDGYRTREYRDRLVRLLRARFEKPLSGCRILDIGCGHGSLLGWFHEQGVPAGNLFGVDLLANRIEIARSRFPSFTFQATNAERLGFPEGSFGLVPVFTVFSSILDFQMADNLAQGIGRMLSPGGAVVWYDVRYPNPWNPHLRGMTKRRIRALFPRFTLDLETISLFPPLARRLGPLIDLAYPLLAAAHRSGRTTLACSGRHALDRVRVVALWMMVAAIPVAGSHPVSKAGFYVSPTGSDSNDGPRTRPFRTIVAASRAAQPDTTIHVLPGTYQGGFLTAASGAPSAPITYISDVPHGAKIVGGGPATNPNKAGWENRGDYVTVKGFEFDGSGGQAESWAFGFYNAASHVTLEGSKVHDVMTDAAAYEKLTSANNGGAGVMMDSYYGGSDGSVIGNIVYNIGPSGSRSFLVHGIYQTETGRVLNNIVYDVAGSGIQLWHGAHHIDVIHNTVDSAAGDAGIMIGSGDSGSSSTTGDYVMVRGNIIVNSSAGIAEGGTTGLHNRYIDNLVHNNTLSGITLRNDLAAEGTVTADPRFVDPAHHDYRLCPGSPAIRAADALGALPSPIKEGQYPIQAAKRCASHASDTRAEPKPARPSP